MRAPPRRGITLVELLISAALLGIVLTATYTALHLSLRYADRTRDAADIQKETLTVMTRIEDAMRDGIASTIVINPAGTAIAFASCETAAGVFDHDAQGRPKAQRMVCLYEEIVPGTPPVRTIRRKDLLLTPPTSDYATLPVADPDAMAADPTLEPVILTEHEQSVEFTLGAAVVIDLALRSPRQNGNGLQILSRVCMRL